MKPYQTIENMHISIHHYKHLASYWESLYKTLKEQNANYERAYKLILEELLELKEEQRTNVDRALDNLSEEK